MSNIIRLDQNLPKEYTQNVETDIFNYRSKELFINLKESDIPPYGHKDREAFIQYEENKSINGVTVNGQFIPGTFYWDFNHWAIMRDVIDNRGIHSTKALRPDIRDNDWIIHNALHEAYLDKENLEMGTARQISKSKNIASIFGRDLMLYDNRINLLMAGAAVYLVPIMEYLYVGTENCTDFLRVPRLTHNKREITIRWGFKTPQNEEIVKSMLHIRNAKAGKNTEVSAGVTIHRAAVDEIATFPFRSSYETIKPALVGQDGIRDSSLLAFCVCEGTKVWNCKGDFKNIEDLEPEEGILGFNLRINKVSKEPITYYQEPFEKLCYKITTISGRTLECSFDHPIYTREKYDSGSFKQIAKFKNTSNIQVGEAIAVADEINIWGNKKFKDGKLIGWLVGDGTYGESEKLYTKKDGTITISKSINIKLANADPEIWSYIVERYPVRNHLYETYTKDGRIMRKAGINTVFQQVRDAGIAGQTKDNKRLPTNIHSYTKKDVCDFLGGYFDADGNVYIDYKTNRCQVKLSSANIEILKETQFILQKLGIQSKLYWCKPNFNNPLTTRGHWNLNINEKQSLINFYENISFTVKYKQEKLEEIYNLKLNSVKSGKSLIKGLRFEKVKSIEKIGHRKVYNLTASATNTYFANGIFTHNTGGNAEKSMDAEEIFMNPKAAKFKEFDNNGKKTGLFIGGWYRQDLKKEVNFGEWLGIEDKSSELYDLTIRVADIDHANKVLDEEEAQAAKSKDPTALIKQKMYNPRKIEDMFLTPNKNPFNIDALQRHYEYLMANPIGVPVELIRKADGQVSYIISKKKPIMSYPVDNVLIDLNAPIMMYDEPRYTDHYDLHILGVDAYNQSQSPTSPSLGSVYVIRRIHSDLTDTFISRIVASYTARPNRLKEFFQNVEMLQELYNGSIFFEHSGSPFLMYFEERFKTHILMDGFSLQREITPNSKSGATKGFAATPANQQYLLNIAVMYTDELLPNGQLGLTRIPDPMLVKELIAYDGEKNVDRYDAFVHALANMYSKMKYSSRPFITTFEETKTERKPITYESAFGSVLSNTNSSIFKSSKNNAFGF